jgi:hypothetical protein
MNRTSPHPANLSNVSILVVLVLVLLISAGAG